MQREHENMRIEQPIRRPTKNIISYEKQKNM